MTGWFLYLLLHQRRVGLVDVGVRLIASLELLLDFDISVGRDILRLWLLLLDLHPLLLVGRCLLVLEGVVKILRQLLSVYGSLPISSFRGEVVLHESRVHQEIIEFLRWVGV